MDRTYLKDLTPEEVIRRLKAGEVVKHDKGNYQKKWIDGIICTIFNDGVFVINDFLGDNESAYFETPDELKLEVGKCYRTRDGRKAFVFYKRAEEKDYPFKVCISNEKIDFYMKEDGSHSCEIDDLDLISEWRDDEEKEND